MSIIKKRLSLIVIFFVIFFTQACSRLQLVYDFAPRLIANNLDENFDFSSQRYSEVKSTIARDFKVNQDFLKSQLLDVIEDLLTLSEVKTLTSIDVEKIYQKIHSSQIKIVYTFKPSFTEVLNKATPKELLHYKLEIEKKHKKFSERLASMDEFLDTSTDKFEDNMDMIFDDVTTVQKQLYRNFILKNYSYFVLQKEHKTNYLNKFDSLFNNKEELTLLSLKYFSGDASLKSEEYQIAHKKFLNDMFIETVNLWKTLSPEQLKHFKYFLNKLKSEITNLKIE